MSSKVKDNYSALGVTEVDRFSDHARIGNYANVNFNGEVDGCKLFVVHVGFFATLSYSHPAYPRNKAILEKEIQKVQSWIEGNDLVIGSPEHTSIYGKIDFSQYVAEGEVIRCVNYKGRAYALIVGTPESVNSTSARFIDNQDLRNPNEDPCGDTVAAGAYAGGFPEQDIFCERATGHVGNHYVFASPMNYKWGGKGGAAALNGVYMVPFGIPSHCESCGMASTTFSLEPAGKYSELCKDCHFWLEPDAYRIVIDSEQYSVSSGMPGFGGRDFHVEFFDTNRKNFVGKLSHQGTIPVHLRGEIPNNARFIK